MKPPDPDDGSADADEFERAVEAFEHAWRCGTPPAIEDYLPAESSQGEQRRRLLHELVAVDLEFRWRAAAASPGSHIAA